MESIKRERGVLKLVHPGRHIEVHREPIRASEVMRKNPRHCITRPDVFKFPWIVVKPNSILLPGSVFLIVPNHTIYDLLKSKGLTNQKSPSSQHNQSPNNHDFNISKMPRDNENACKNQSFVYDDDEEDSHKEMEALEESSFEFRPYHQALQFYQNYSRDIGTEMVKNLEFVSNKQVTILKSCFRRPDSMRRSLNLKVSFDISIEKDEQQKINIH